MNEDQRRIYQYLDSGIKGHLPEVNLLVVYHPYR